jgi:anti-sigma B factor antagonist
LAWYGRGRGGQEEERVDFGVSTTQDGDYAVVAVTGELDVYTAPVLEESLGELVEGGNPRLVVDLTEVTFMDSTGLGLLIKALKWTRELDGSLKIVANTDKVLKVFRVTGLDGVLSLHETRAEATGS